MLMKLELGNDQHQFWSCIIRSVQMQQEVLLIGRPGAQQMTSQSSLARKT